MENVSTSVSRTHNGFDIELVIEDGFITTSKVYNRATGEMVAFLELEDGIEWTVGNVRKTTEDCRKYIDENVALA